jgi:maltose-6'-phosphate glucosidase
MMIEVTCRVGNHGAEPLALPPVGTFYKGLLENRYTYEKLTVDGFLESNIQKLLQAWYLAKVILDDLMEANVAYWPTLK